MGYPLWGQVSPFGRLNESPSQKEGKFEFAAPRPVRRFASMKAPPKRKGNPSRCRAGAPAPGLNESPSEIEGKSR